MLVSVNGDRPLFGDAGADAVCAFDCFGPHAVEPGSPVFESARICFVTAMFDCDACGVTEEKRVSGLAHQLVKSIDLLLCAEDQLVERLAELPELSGRQDSGRLAAGLTPCSFADLRQEVVISTVPLGEVHSCVTQRTCSACLNVISIDGSGLPILGRIPARRCIFSDPP